MSRAVIKLSGSTELIDADVIDVSSSGMRLAVSSVYKPKQGTTCIVQLTPDGCQNLQLQGEIRWMEEHPLITVFGVLLEPESDKNQFS
jgi:PilZ domain